MHRMTAKQKQVLDFLKTVSDIAPSYEEIRVACGFASKSQVYRVMNALRERGRVDWLPGKRRSLKVMDMNLSPVEAKKKTINDCISLLEETPKCRTAVWELRKALVRIELEQEVYG